MAPTNRTRSISCDLCSHPLQGPAGPRRPQLSADCLSGPTAVVDDPDRHGPAGHHRLRLDRVRRPGRGLPGYRRRSRRTDHRRARRPHRAADHHADRLPGQCDHRAGAGRDGAAHRTTTRRLRGGGADGCVGTADRAADAGPVGWHHRWRPPPRDGHVVRGCRRRDHLRPRTGHRQPARRGGLPGLGDDRRRGARRSVRDLDGGPPHCPGTDRRAQPQRINTADRSGPGPGPWR